MNGDIGPIILGLIGMVLPWIVVLWALRLQSKIYSDLSRTIDRTTSNQNAIVSEVLSHKTLAETGDRFIAGEMLRHSNAHDFRQNQPPEPPPLKLEDAQGPNLSPEFQLGGEDFETFTPPTPGEER